MSYIQTNFLFPDPDMSSSRFRVASRYIAATTQKRVARGLPLGRTFQNEKVRVHRWADFLEVTDLTNAGKKGKTCDRFRTNPVHPFSGDKAEWFDRISGEFLEYSTKSDPYRSMISFIKDLIVDFPKEIRLDEEKVKSYNVEPFGPRFDIDIPLEDGKSSIRVNATPYSAFVVNHHWMSRGFYQDTSYHADKRKDAVLFYGWMKENSNKVTKFKSMDDFKKVWDSLGANFDYH